MGLSACPYCRKPSVRTEITIVETVSVNRRQFLCEVVYTKCHTCLSQFESLVQFGENYNRRVLKYHVLYNERGKLRNVGRRGRNPKIREVTEYERKLGVPYQQSLFDDDELGG